MGNSVIYSTPSGVMEPIGPYSHISKAGNFISIGAVAGVNPSTGLLVDSDITGQTVQIIRSFKIMLSTVGSSLDDILHINVFLKDMADFSAMNAAYEKAMDGRRPPRTAIAVRDLPKSDALVTMNLTAVAKRAVTKPSNAH